MNTQIVIPFTKTDPNAVMPTKANALDAGWDFYRPEDVLELDYVILPRSRRLIDTGIAIAIPPGWYMQLQSRSGLALKHGIQVMGGVIDSGYRGSIGVILLNTSRDQVTIEPGTRIAQGILLPVPNVFWKQVDSLPQSVRGDGGFGSTGA